jgi:EmrB/QacA subfamily drug resistance transporter
MQEQGGERAERVDRATWMVAGTVVLGSVMSVVDTTIVNVALDDLARDFGVSITEIHWVASGYLLALAITIPLAGWASERFGAKRVWMTSVALFLAGSMLAGLSWSIDSLIAFRLLQGFGGGMIIPVGMSMLARAAGPGRLGRVMSVIGIAQLLGPVLGPVLGGLLVEHAGWRWIFYVNVPVGVLALMLATRSLPTEQPEPCERLDVSGFALLSPGLAVLVFGLAETAGGGFADPRALGPIVAGLALVAAFVVHARRVPNPLIDVRLLQTRAFAAASGTTFSLAMGTFGAMFLLPLYYQTARGLSPAEAGLMLAPQGLGAAIMMPLAGRLTDRIGPGRVVLAGLTLIVLGTVPLAFAGAASPYPQLAGALFVRGLGLGASMMPAQTAAFATLGRDTGAAHGTSAVNAIQRMGGALGVAVMSVVLDHNLRAGPAAPAFGQSFAWPVVMTLLAFVPAAFLPRRPAGAKPRQGIARGRDGSPVGARSQTT